MMGIKKMKIIRKILVISCLWLLINSCFINAFNAGDAVVITKTVCDMTITAPVDFTGFKDLAGDEKIEQFYKDFSCSPDTKKCFRAHQGLFNDKLTVVSEKGDFVSVVYPNNSIVYGYDEKEKKFSEVFWIYKNYIAKIKDVKNSGILNAIPGYFDEKTDGKELVTLIWPFKSIMGKTFSLGTKFVREKEKDKFDEQNNLIEYAILVPDYDNQKLYTDYVKKEDVVLSSADFSDKYDKKSSYNSNFFDNKNDLDNKNNNEREKGKDRDFLLKRLAFVKVVNNLIDRIDKNFNGNVIPYVWGGSSFTNLYDENKFEQKKDESGSDWQRDGKLEKIYNGYDCSEFVMRMAKVAGLNFPYKITSMIEKFKTGLEKTDKVQDGDLVWVPGHIMIVGSVENNELIESRGYGSGFGCVHRIKLKDIFNGIETYEQLKQVYDDKKPLELIDKFGKVQKKYDSFKILSLI